MSDQPHHTLTAVEQALADAVYDFLVVEGYHGHYPSAEQAAEKFVRTRGQAFAARLAAAERAVKVYRDQIISIDAPHE